MYTAACTGICKAIILAVTLAVILCLPGSSDNNLFQDDSAFKNGFHCLMSPEWQLNFGTLGNALKDAAHTINRLAAFMEQ